MSILAAAAQAPGIGRIDLTGYTSHIELTTSWEALSVIGPMAEGLAEELGLWLYDPQENAWRVPPSSKGIRPWGAIERQGTNALAHIEKFMTRREDRTISDRQRRLMHELPGRWTTPWGDEITDENVDDLFAGRLRIDSRRQSDARRKNLLSQLNDADKFQRIDAASELGHWHATHEIVAALRRLLDEEDPGVSSVAAMSLGKLQDVGSRLAIVRLVDRLVDQGALPSAAAAANAVADLSILAGDRARSRMGRDLERWGRIANVSLDWLAEIDRLGQKLRDSSQR